MTQLQAHKRLLLAESELNRTLLAADLAGLNAGVRTLTNRAKSISSIATTVAVLVTGLTAFQRSKPANGSAKHPWASNILKTAGLLSNLWLAFGPRARGDDDKQPHPRL